MVKLPSGAELHTACNFQIDHNTCTYQTCCISEQGQIGYLPTIPGNAVYAGCFAILLLAQLFLGIKYKTWSFVTWMFFGIVGELIGYVARIWLHINVFSFNAFLM